MTTPSLPRPLLLGSVPRQHHDALTFNGLRLAPCSPHCASSPLRRPSKLVSFDLVRLLVLLSDSLTGDHGIIVARLASAIAFHRTVYHAACDQQRRHHDQDRDRNNHADSALCRAAARLATTAAAASFLVLLLGGLGFALIHKRRRVDCRQWGLAEHGHAFESGGVGC